MPDSKLLKIKIGDKEVSYCSSAFVIAEAACNHMCDLLLAKRMIKEAKDNGADAIKFQTYKAERLVCREAATYWNYSGGTKSQFEYYKKLDRFGRREYASLFAYARKLGIIAFSTPFDVDSASMLNELGVPLFKIASCDLLDVRLLRRVARFGKPVILSTGAGTLKEIHGAVDTVFSQGNRNLILMACTLSYPCKDSGAHLNRIAEFRKKFPDVIIGYSDHTLPDANMIIPSLAFALGARVIEKHFTLDRKMTGSGHSFSIEPADLNKMVVNIRLAQTALGESAIKVYDVEEAARKNARRSVVADVKIFKGRSITSAMLGVKRPSGGIAPSEIDKIIGKMAKRDIEKDALIEFKNLY